LRARTRRAQEQGDHKGQSISKKMFCESNEAEEGSLCGERSFAALRMTERDSLFFEMD
jgi:hypothetical protein